MYIPTDSHWIFSQEHLHFDMLEWRKSPKATYVRNRSVPLNVQRKGKSKIRKQSKAMNLNKKLQNLIRLIYWHGWYSEGRDIQLSDY